MPYYTRSGLTDERERKGTPAFKSMKRFTWLVILYTDAHVGLMHHDCQTLGESPHKPAEEFSDSSIRPLKANPGLFLKPLKTVLKGGVCPKFGQVTGTVCQIDGQDPLKL